MHLCFVVAVDPETEKTQMFGVRYMPVWVYTLAAHLRSQTNIQLTLVDTRLQSSSEIPQADCYFFSALNQDVPANLALLRKLKNLYPASKFALGGPAVGSLKLAHRLHEVAEFDGLFLGEGETSVLEFILKLRGQTDGKQLVFTPPERFDISQALPMDYQLLSQTAAHYYGGVIEVSRGCPFLCEFCDIRTLPDNNKAHNKPVETVIADLEQFHRLNITNVLFACDNFIGDPVWAGKLCDAIISFREKYGYKLRCYTWLTINIANHPELIRKMKAAGFDMFFIGLESFGTNQLLETAKVQNTKFDLPEAVRRIQAFGIVVVAGLIFGFDSDNEETTQEALDGILESGLISGDPTLLTALSGTPLYRRMQLAGRLREGKVALGGHKYSTNIRYLRPKERIISDYCYFVKTFNSSDFQLKRYGSFLNCLEPQEKAQTSEGGGYIQPEKLLGLVMQNREAMKSAFHRITRFLASPERLTGAIRGAIMTAQHPMGTWAHYFFWVFNWSNSIVKYGDISSKDFNIESVQGAITPKHLLPDGYQDDYFEPIPNAKIKAQRQLTTKTLSKIYSTRTG
jgi:radical SAM superfamily enzyme YgiQ (UPF0313 family)